MKFEQYLNEMIKVIKQQPENIFESSLSEFMKDAGDSFKKISDKQLKKQKKIVDAESDPLKKRKLQDAYDNKALMIGASDVFSQFDVYSIQGMLYNWHLWTGLYMNSWVFAKVINRVSSDMIRNGWKIKLDVKRIYEIENKNGKVTNTDITPDIDITPLYKKQRMMIDKIISVIRWTRLYGGGVLCLLDSTIKDENEYEKPLEKIDPDAKLEYLVADRWLGVIPSVEMVSDIGDNDFDTPKYYTVTTDSGQSYRFHHTRVARFVNGEAPSYIKRLLMGWGLPEGIRLFNEINRDERIKNTITSLLSKHNLEIVKTDGMRAYMTGNLSPEMESQLDNKLEIINRYRNFNSTIFLDKNDDYIRQEGNVSGLYQLLDSNARFVAGAADMPQVLLYGDQQNGLSGNTFDDLRLYEDKIGSDREQILLNPISKITKWHLMHEQIEYEDFSIHFNSALPETIEQKIERSRQALDMYRDLIDMTIYNPYMVAKEIKASDDYLFGAELTDDVITKLDPDNEINKEEIETDEDDEKEDKKDSSTRSSATPGLGESDDEGNILFEPGQGDETEEEDGIEFQDLPDLD